MTLDELREFAVKFFDYHYFFVEQEARRLRRIPVSLVVPTPPTAADLEKFLDSLRYFPDDPEFQNFVAAVFFSSINTELYYLISVKCGSKIRPINFIENMFQKRSDLINYLQPVMEQVSQRTVVTHCVLGLGLEGLQLIDRYLTPGQRLEYYNGCDVLGMTPLMHACKAGDYEVAVHLLAKGANPGLIDVHRMTALNYAVAGGFDWIVNAMIQTYGKDRCAPSEAIHPLCCMAFSQTSKMTSVLVGLGLEFPLQRHPAPFIPLGQVRLRSCPIVVFKPAEQAAGSRVSSSLRRNISS